MVLHFTQLSTGLQLWFFMGYFSDFTQCFFFENLNMNNMHRDVVATNCSFI